VRSENIFFFCFEKTLKIFNSEVIGSAPESSRVFEDRENMFLFEKHARLFHSAGVLVRDLWTGSHSTPDVSTCSELRLLRERQRPLARLHHQPPGIDWINQFQPTFYDNYIFGKNKSWDYIFCTSCCWLIFSAKKKF
jgi:hypothetical protein